MTDANAMLEEGGANFDAEAAQFQTLLMGIEIDKLKEGLTAISKEKANEYLKNVSHQQQIADSNKGLRSYISSWIFTQPASSEATATTKQPGSRPGTPKSSGGAASLEASAAFQVGDDDDFVDAVESQE